MVRLQLYLKHLIKLPYPIWYVLRLTTSHFTLFISFAENRLLPTEVRKEALDLQKLVEFDDEGGEGDSFFLSLILESSFICCYM